MKFITYDSIPSLPAFIADLTTRIADPGAFITREDIGTGDGARAESVSRWGARAIANMFTTDEASDGSAQPVSNEARRAEALDILKEAWPEAHAVIVEARNPIILGTRQQSSAAEFRDLLNAAKGVTPDQLELQLVRGHIAEAARVFEIVRAENNQLRNFLWFAGDLLGRADADPIKLAQKVEAGIIDLHAKCEGQAKEIERASTRYDGERKAATLLREERDRCRAAYAAERERAVDLQSQVEQERGWLEATRKERDTFRENADDLGREVDKARRVIIGNTGGTIDDSGSLLDMLNVLIERARPNYSSSPSAL